MPQILDQYGRPIDTGALRTLQTADSAMLASLEGEFDAHPAKGLTPQRINAIMSAAEQGDLIQQLELADDMEERDGHIYSEINKRKQALLKLDWDILPPEDASADEKKQADQVKEWIRAIPDFKRRILFNMTDAILKGFAATEIWWELEEGFLQPRFEWRPQRWFTLNEQRTKITLRNAAMQYGEPLRPFNWLFHLHPARNGFVSRQALARVLMLPYLYKNYSTRDFAEFLEIYGLPLRLGKYPSGAGDEEKRRLLQAVVGIGHNAAGIIPMGTEIEFQNATSGVDVPFSTMMERMDAIQSKVIVGQTLTSGEGKHGTQALGAVHNEIRLDLVAADADLVNGTLTSQLVAPMVLLNLARANPKRLPRFVLQVPKAQDIKAFADSMPALARAGMRIGVDWAHDTLDIPKAGADEEVLTGADPAPGPGDPQASGAAPTLPPAPGAKPAEKPAAKKAALSGGANARGRDALDDLAEEAVGEWQPLLRPMVDPLLAALDAAVQRGESIEMFRAQLPALVDQMDSTALAGQLARSMFVGRLAGEADLQLDPSDSIGR